MPKLTWGADLGYPKTGTEGAFDFVRPYVRSLFSRHVMFKKKPSLALLLHAS